MSLINDALRKARAEAARQRPADIALPFEPTPPLPAHPGRLRIQIPLLAVALVVLLAVLLSVVANRLLRPTLPSSSAAADARPLIAPIEPRLTLPPPPSPAAMLTTAEPAPAPPSSGPATPAELSLAPRRPLLVEGRVYLQSLEVEGLPRLKLDGILWSEKNPLALINGVTAAPGDDLGDVLVVQVEPKRVKLRARDKDFFLRLP